MTELLANPAFQSGVLPFVVGLIIWLVMLRAAPAWAGIAIIVGFLATAELITDIRFSPLSSTRKIMLIALLAVPFAALRDILPVKDKHIHGLFFPLAGGLALWVLWPALQRMQGVTLAFTILTAFMYAGWMLATADRMRKNTSQSLSYMIALGVGTGGVAIMGATALLGQLAMALGMAAAGGFLVYLITAQGRAGAVALYPAVLASSLLAINAVVYASLPWYIPAIFMMIPWLTWTPIPNTLSDRLQRILRLLLCLLPVALALVVAWVTAGPPPF